MGNLFEIYVNSLDEAGHPGGIGVDPASGEDWQAVFIPWPEMTAKDLREELAELVEKLTEETDPVEVERIYFWEFRPLYFNYWLPLFTDTTMGAPAEGDDAGEEDGESG